MHPKLRKNLAAGFGAILGLSLVGALPADAIADRRAVEEVYYKHRLGTKPPFAETMPPKLLAELVQRESHREWVLKSAYGVEIQAAQVEAEVKRIESTSKAPEVLAEIQAALGGDRARFAATVARPIVVERMLRARFEADAALHAPQRQAADAVRTRLLAAKEKGGEAALAAARATTEPAPREVTWKLGSRSAPLPTPVVQAPAQATKGTASSKSYSIEAEVSQAQVLSPPPTPGKERDDFYFEDLDPELQRVLQVQLKGAGDVSAVIESGQVFQVFACAARNPGEMRVLVFVWPKRSFDEWLAGQ